MWTPSCGGSQIPKHSNDIISLRDVLTSESLCDSLALHKSQSVSRGL